MRKVFMVTVLWVIFLSLIFPGVSIAAKKEAPKVQIAILLDTSSSMSGLIEQAKSQLWNIVNEFTKAKSKGERPRIEVALFEYGNTRLSAEGGWIRMILPLTDDLDKVYEDLFALTTSGGDEYCGWVIRDAVEGLEWSDSKEVYKVIFIAGNEPFTQGPVDYKESCKSAIEKGIIVNTIHCGNYETGVTGQWKDGALMADGSYLHIDHNQKVVHISAPQDDEINRLGQELNDTYIPYGSSGRAGWARQAAQDANAGSISSGNLAMRNMVKATRVYNNDSWDLVDAVNNGKVALDDVKEKELPEEMRNMSEEQRQAYVMEKQKQRQEIQKRITELKKEREKYVAEQRKKQNEQSGDDSLGQAVLKTVRSQAEERNFTFE